MIELDGLDFEALAAEPAMPGRSADFIPALCDRQFVGRLESLRQQLARDEGFDGDRETAIEWYLDNFYLIRETAIELPFDLPAGFYKDLPAVADPADSSRLVPRIYRLALELLRILTRPADRELLEETLSRYQEHAALTIGELWAFPAVLRAVCLDSIFDNLAEGSTESDEQSPSAAVACAVRTLIALRSFSWRIVFNRCSLVRRELLRDPAGVFEQTGAATRDRYLREVEKLAARADMDEVAVAARVVELAGDSRHSEDPVECHVGYFLIDAGRSELEASLGVRPTLRERGQRFLRRQATPLYLGAIAVATAAALLPVYWLSMRHDASVFMLVLALGASLVPASAFAIAWVQWLITLIIEPVRLPRLSLKTGITAEHKTIVVIPALLGDLADVHSLVERLELHYLANPETDLQFAILADYTDAESKDAAGDVAVLQRARDGIRLLNERHREAAGEAPFHLLVRERQYNPAEGVWMGWERKRGKLEEFNRLLAGNKDTSYVFHEGEPGGLENIRFVITLDADTELPRDAARRLVAILAHPLNRARLAPRSEPSCPRVVAGYTVLQPRLDIHPESATRSRFSRIFAGDRGLDIYSRAVSDVYQDFFGTGIYVGKGIYDVDAFRRCLEGQVPDNTLLSHDLFEGNFGRVGLASDVVLYEDYPPSFVAYARRLHRWIRGDWQLLPWLRASVPTGGGKRTRNPFSHIDRWKVLDNLRRSLFPVTLLTLLLFAWTWLPGSGLLWTGLALVFSSGHVLTSIATRLRGVAGRSLHSARRTLTDLRSDVERWLVSLAFLPHEAVVVVDAVARTMVRMLFTRRRLLEWTTAAHTARGIAARSSRGLVWWEMIGGPVAALGAVAAALLWKPSTVAVAAVFAVAWASSPELALLLARGRTTPARALAATQKDRLRLLSRRIWLFFEHFVGPDDHWLPPDNVQLSPSVRVAHRTSPTNVGLYLASCATACDLGYIEVNAFCARVSMTLRELEELPRHRGQLLNWYDTRSREGLAPQYVSTVDNGNLAACLIAVRQACSHYATAPILRREPFVSIKEISELIAEVLDLREDDQPEVARALRKIRHYAMAGAAATRDPRALARVTEGLERSVQLLSDALRGAVARGGLKGGTEVLDWVQALNRQVAGLRSTIDGLARWLVTLCEAPPPVAKAMKTEHERLIAECTRLSPNELVEFAPRMADFMTTAAAVSGAQDFVHWRDRVARELAAARQRAEALVCDVLDVGGHCERELSQMDFGLLFDREANQLFIGLDARSSRPDPHHYDLLASEARLASLVAIALGQVPMRHWMHLGRPIARVAGDAALLSWSGTLFEYLMPLLFTKSAPSSLLGKSVRAAVRQQIAYARKHDVPWGMSESGFASVDSRGDYQYRAFGSPGLGLKRGLEEDLVVSPYASLLAVSLDPLAVLENVSELCGIGACKHFGLVEAIDFTPGRQLPESERSGDEKRGLLVDAYMAHHQGMAMIALGNALAGESMVERFHSDARIRTVAHLLEEHLPHEIPSVAIPASVRQVDKRKKKRSDVQANPWHPRPEVAAEATEAHRLRLVEPALHVISNGAMHLQVDALGRSRLWSGDADLRPMEFGGEADREGSFCLYARIGRDAPATLISGGVSEHSVARRRATYWPHRAQWITHLSGANIEEDVFLAPKEPIEFRRIRIANLGEEALTVELCGYSEVALLAADEHHRHPAFSRLFLETLCRESGRLLVCRRRARAPGDRHPVLAQALAIGAIDREGSEPAAETSIAWETSRESFVGRGRSLATPLWLDPEEGRLPGRAGHVLDPCLVQSADLLLPAGASQTVVWVTAIGADEGQAVARASSYMHVSRLDAALEGAQRAAVARLGMLGLEESDPPLAQELHAQLMSRSISSEQNKTSVPGSIRPMLWAHGISGDRPIALVHHRLGDQELVRQILRLGRYLQVSGVFCDVVIVLHEAGGYFDETRDQILRLARAGGSSLQGLVVVSASQLSPTGFAAMELAARIVLDTGAGGLREQLGRGLRQPKILPALSPSTADEGDADPASAMLQRPGGLAFDCGLGGFDPGQKEYVVYLDPRDPAAHSTPAPWCNVLANPSFGTLVSERGLGHTWAQNSSENRLTPWSNDAVRDLPAECLYLRDEVSTAVWTPTPGPRPSGRPYEVAHGIGYTRYRHHCHGVQQIVRVAVDPEDGVKLIELILENRSPHARRLSATYVVRWVLGNRLTSNAPHVVQTYEPELAALFARSRWNVDFPDQVAFLGTDCSVHGFTTDAVEFFGIGGDEMPDALTRSGLSNSEDGGHRSCGALQVHLDLEPGSTVVARFAIGWGEDEGAARALAGRLLEADYSRQLPSRVRRSWEKRLGRFSVSTPDPETDLMLNTWCPYQTLSCRFFAREGFYQSAGAFGFRDQLQDAIALSLVAPELARDHILLAARHQFEEGDVLHWWHPPHGAGVRTRCSDDLLWLPYVVSHYVEKTGDEEILGESLPFLSGPSLAVDETERYARFAASEQVATLYEHCLRALERGYSIGAHGLPRIGTGDWNDGMNRVGIEGRGESVWLGWFLYATTRRFAEVAAGFERGDELRRLRERAGDLLGPLDRAWDGAWYRRAYYDDGTPLGSSESMDASIDSISQSWAALSGGASDERARQAVQSACRALVDDEERIVRLLWPPFDRDGQEPGYIKGYPPGIRENGAQYTHAAIWLSWALFELGESERAEELFRYLNPITHARTLDAARRFAVEPYVLSGDVYSVGALRGRGGWSWYTGSSAWYWLLGVEALLGIRITWPYLEINPGMPKRWSHFTARVAVAGCRLAIDVMRAGPNVGMFLDGVRTPEARVDLRRLRGEHAISVVLGATDEPREAASAPSRDGSAHPESAPQSPGPRAISR